MHEESELTYEKISDAIELYAEGKQPWNRMYKWVLMDHLRKIRGLTFTDEKFDILFDEFIGEHAEYGEVGEDRSGKYFKKIEPKIEPKKESLTPTPA